MKCPKCDEGTIIKIRFKTDGKIAFLCNFCDSLWFEDEHINTIGGHTLRSFSEKQNGEYTIEEINEKDQEHKSISESHYR